MDTGQQAFTFGKWADLTIGYDDALARLPDALKAEGFGVITEIDFKAAFKAKLGVDFPRYRVLGACNPEAAHKALLRDASIGVFLPCNVVLYEREPGRARVGAVDPMQTVGANSQNRDLVEIASDIQARLQRVIGRMAAMQA